MSSKFLFRRFGLGTSQSSHTRWGRLTYCGLVILSVAPLGCASRSGPFGIDCCADVPAGAIPEPSGSKLCQWHEAMVGSALADQTVLYRADFRGDTTTLSPGAAERLARNVSSGLINTQPTLIEPSGQDSLDTQRVDRVTTVLASLGINVPVVEVATPAALGLSGPQAERVASGFGTIRNSSAGTPTPLAQPGNVNIQNSSLGGLPGGIF